jgi:rfaE bifunctional protein kinase chain/domain
MINSNIFNNIKVLVIGDIILDKYISGDINRISPEAPVPILSTTKIDFRLGGAANVALNCKALGADTSLISIIGNDSNGKLILDLLNEHGIICDGIGLSDNRISTLKTRLLSNNQQLLRIDDEVIFDISEIESTILYNSINDIIKKNKPNIIIFEDYDKGVLSKKLIEKIILLSKDNNIITCVDPKEKNFFCYQNVDIFKPNLREVRNALNINIDIIDINTLNSICIKLREKLNPNNLVVTLSEFGIYYNDQNTSEIIPAHLRNVFDVCGAGDTVIATLSLFYYYFKDIKRSSKIANLAGGLVCEQVGTAVINKIDLFKKINNS